MIVSTKGVEAFKAVNNGLPITQDVFDAAVTYAKDKKRKRPVAFDGQIVEADVTPSNGKTNGIAKKTVAKKTVAKKTVAKKTVAKKTAKKAVAPKVPRIKQTACDEKDCKKPHYSKGKCVAHYAQARRQDPAERAKANEASKQYRERQRAAVAVTAK